MTQDVVPLLPEKDALTRHRLPLHALTGVRFFAASYVLLYHSRAEVVFRQHRAVVLANFVGNGYEAVPLFFMLSGFILAYTYRAQIEKRGDTLRFFEARFARIWPAYALSLVLAAMAAKALPPLGIATATLLMVQSWNPWHPEYPFYTNNVCWSLSVEAFFYLCFPLLQRGIERLTQRWLGVLATSAVVVCIAANTAIRTLGDPAYEGVFHLIPLPVTHLPEFIVGVAAGNLFLERGPVAGPRGGWLTWLGAALSLVMFATPRGPWSSLVLIGFATMLYGLAAERTGLSRLLSHRALLVGGGISYAMYLLQIPVRDFTQNCFNRVHIDSSVGKFIASYCLTIVAALATFYWIEAPARDLLRRGFGAMRKKLA